MPEQSGGGNRFTNLIRAMGQRAGRGVNNTPIVQLFRNGPRAAWNATPIMRLVHALGSGQQNAPRGTMDPNAFAMGPPQYPMNMDPNAAAMGPPELFGPPEQSAHLGMGPPAPGQQMGLGGRDPNRAAGMMNPGGTGANLMGTMGIGAILRQAGDSGLGRQRPQQN